MSEYLTMQQWTEASIEQRQAWLDQGRLISPEDGQKLRQEAEEGRREYLKRSRVRPIGAGPYF